MNILCKLGFHKWIIIKFDTFYNKNVTFNNPSKKWCKRCGRIDKCVSIAKSNYGDIIERWHRIK